METSTEVLLAMGGRMRVRRKVIELRKLEHGKEAMVETMRRELVQGAGANGRWRSRFLASGKVTRGKIVIPRG
jgi:hypothetical protein